jgi:hypothetical protein
VSNGNGHTSDVQGRLFVHGVPPDADGKWRVPVGMNDFQLLGIVDPGAWAVFLALQWFAREKDTCHPSLLALVEMLGKDKDKRGGERTIRYAIDRLVNAGLVQRVATRGKVTEYHLRRKEIDCLTSTEVRQPVSESKATGFQDQGNQFPKLRQPVSSVIDKDKGTRQRNKTRRALRFDAADMTTAVWMFSLIQAIDAKAKKPNLDGWANEIRLMREQDGRADQEIREVFEWANQDNFWRSNILSPGKLREKFTTLLSQRNRNGSTSKRNSHVGPGQRHEADCPGIGRA